MEKIGLNPLRDSERVKLFYTLGNLTEIALEFPRDLSAWYMFCKTLHAAILLDNFKVCEDTFNAMKSLDIDDACLRDNIATILRDDSLYKFVADKDGQLPYSLAVIYANDYDKKIMNLDQPSKAGMTLFVKAWSLRLRSSSGVLDTFVLAEAFKCLSVFIRKEHSILDRLTALDDKSYAAFADLVSKVDWDSLTQFIGVAVNNFTGFLFTISDTEINEKYVNDSIFNYKYIPIERHDVVDSPEVTADAVMAIIMEEFDKHSISPEDKVNVIRNLRDKFSKMLQEEEN